MKSYLLAAAALAVLTLCIFRSAFAVDGEPYIHDPSTVIFCDGKYYTYGTGGGGLISEDGWTWHGGAVRPGGGAAPDDARMVRQKRGDSDPLLLPWRRIAVKEARD